MSSPSGLEPSDASEDETVEADGVGALAAAADESAPDCAAEVVEESEEADVDELDSDDELDDERGSGESGDPQATPGVLDTAAPMPDATASAPTRPMFWA